MIMNKHIGIILCINGSQNKGSVTLNLDDYPKE